MKKINTSPLSGMQELLPAEQAIFNNLKSKISEVYHRHGFQAIETPSIERAEVLLAKAGGDTEKQIYKVNKTGDSDTAKDIKEALRFDHTVPLARYIVEHESQLAFPFKASQIGLNFRGERAQKGRFREFYQCDIDVIGREKLSLAYDADVISTLLDTFINFGLDTPVLARINNRKILAGFLEFFNLTDKSAEITSIIDHAEKVTPEQTKVSFEEIGLDQPTIKRLLDFIGLHGDRFTIITALNNLEIVNNTFIEGVTELDEVLYLLEATGLAAAPTTDTDITAPAIIEADMQIIRGLDYYTGTVFEFNLPEYKNLGSVAGGGRYDNLTKHFSDKSFPGVGGSIGLTRLFYVLNEHHLLTSTGNTLLNYAIIPVSEHEFDESFNVASKLRAKGHSATIVFAGKKLGDKLTYATKVAAQGIILGEEEVKSGTLQAKNFATGEISALNMNVVSNPEDFWTD